MSIIEAIDAIPTLCDHVHLPVQSGSSRVLKMMAREYTTDWYLERISWIKGAKRKISLSTDIIVGFSLASNPDDFVQTMDFAEGGRVRLRVRFQILRPTQNSGFDHDRFRAGN